MSYQPRVVLPLLKVNDKRGGAIARGRQTVPGRQDRVPRGQAVATVSLPQMTTARATAICTNYDHWDVVPPLCAGQRPYCQATYFHPAHQATFHSSYLPRPWSAEHALIVSYRSAPGKPATYAGILV